MELNDMKDMWQKMDDVLRQQTMINEKMLNYMIKERSTKPFNTLSNAEHFNFISTIVILFASLLLIPYLGNNIGVIICYALMLMAMAATLVYSYRILKQIKKMDPSTTPVADLAQRTEKLKLELNRYKMTFLIAGPALMFLAYVVMFKVVRGVNILDNIQKYTPVILIAIALYTIIFLSVYRTYYFKNIKAIQDNLREAEIFKQQD
ncbi:MAG: hypothetical protein H6551_11060 [Chitinophagales bacterium]|nr:hypothetical protein [Chitinophagaceae bacterium]MCB9065664.1 hypothetical protein [Chitinophagales bacterium]